jgi:hypothetical protein
MMNYFNMHNYPWFQDNYQGMPFNPLTFFALGILAIAIWVYMIVDCARRQFKNNTEKILWIAAMVISPLIAIIAYVLVIRYNNPHGVMDKK